MLRFLLLAIVLARSSGLVLQPGHAHGTAAVRGAAAVRHGAASMQVDWDARKAAEEREKAEAYEKLLAHLRAPIRQYEGGWADTALRDGGKAADRFGTGPDGNLGKDFAEDEEDLIDDQNRMHASIRDVGRRKGKYSSKETTLPADKQAQLVLPEESFKVEKMEMSQTDEDFVMECAAGEQVEMTINVEPMFLVPTEYFYGFTGESDAKISINREVSSDIEGEMAAKGHQEKDEEANIQITLKFTPDAAGEFNAYLGLVFPTEKVFSKFYKITGKSTAGDDATRDPSPMA